MGLFFFRKPADGSENRMVKWIKENTGLKEDDWECFVEGIKERLATAEVSRDQSCHVRNDGHGVS